MKLSRILAAVLASFAAVTLAGADENHEIIEKVMKEGMKGDDSPMAKVIDGNSSATDNEALAKLIDTLKGTKAPRGDQAGFEKKVGELIAAMNAVAGGDTNAKALERLKEAANCKACHSEHKPKKED